MAIQRLFAIDKTDTMAGTPLAAMLPSKYKDCDVTQLFPGFRHNKVLRFSRLFGPKQFCLERICEKSESNRLAIQVANPDEQQEETPSAPASPNAANSPRDDNDVDEDIDCFADWRMAQPNIGSIQ